MIPTKIRWLVLCAALAACADKTPKMAKLNEALPNIPLPPQPSFVGRSGGPDALQVTVRSPASPDAVANYYRGVFKTGNWKLTVWHRGNAVGTLTFCVAESAYASAPCT